MAERFNMKCTIRQLLFVA